MFLLLHAVSCLHFDLSSCFLVTTNNWHQISNWLLLIDNEKGVMLLVPVNYEAWKTEFFSKQFNVFHWKICIFGWLRYFSYVRKPWFYKICLLRCWKDTRCTNWIGQGPGDTSPSSWNSLPWVQDDQRHSQFLEETLLVKEKQEMPCSSAQLGELAAGHRSVAGRMKERFLPRVAWLECCVPQQHLERQEKPTLACWELSLCLFHERG